MPVTNKYFIPRNELLKCFLEDIKKSKKIKILYSSSCESINLDEVGRVTVSITNDYDTSNIKKMSPDLILGCDGINSIVRTWLASNDANADKFIPVSVPSAAAGLKYKMLTLKNRCEGCRVQGDVM